MAVVKKHICIKLCLWLVGVDCVINAWNVQNSFHNHAMGRHGHFHGFLDSDLWENLVEDCKNSVCLSIDYIGKNVEIVHKIINEDPWSTISEITGTFRTFGGEEASEF